MKIRFLPRSTAGWVLLALVVGLAATQIVSILIFQYHLATILRTIQFQNVAARVETIDKIVRALPDDVRPQVLALIEEPGFRLQLTPPGPKEKEADDERKLDLNKRLEDVVQRSRRQNRDREIAIRNQLEEVLETHQEALDRARELEREIDDPSARRRAREASRAAQEQIRFAREQMRRLTEHLRNRGSELGNAYGEPVDDVMLIPPSSAPDPQPNPDPRPAPSPRPSRVIVQAPNSPAPPAPPAPMAENAPPAMPAMPAIPAAPVLTPLQVQIQTQIQTQMQNMRTPAIPPEIAGVPAPPPPPPAPMPSAPRLALSDIFDHKIDQVQVVLPLSGSTSLKMVIDGKTPPGQDPAQLALILIGVGLGIAVIAAAAIQRLTRPLTIFGEAAERLGREIDAPPMPERGPFEVRQAAHAFNQMQERLRRFVRDRTTMLAAISHDLRTPITRAKLRAEFIDDPVQQQKLLNDLDEMDEMIAATMSFARDDAQNELMREIDLAQMLNQVGTEMRELGRDVTVTVHGTDGALPYHCRPMAMKRAVSNLVNNAVAYGKRADIVVDAGAEQIEIRVDDDGPGIPAGDQERVFAPFVRLEESRSRETGGVGLGLSVARSIVRGHGGDLVLENRQPHGLSARILLPK